MRGSYISKWRALPKLAVFIGRSWVVMTWCSLHLWVLSWGIFWLLIVIRLVSGVMNGFSNLWQIWGQLLFMVQLGLFFKLRILNWRIHTVVNIWGIDHIWCSFVAQYWFDMTARLSGRFRNVLSYIIDWSVVIFIAITITMAIVLVTLVILLVHRNNRC